VRSTTLSACLKQLSAFDGDRISLNHICLIEIDPVPATYHTITKLHLSHNRLEKLDGLQQFGSLTHLSIAHNHIKDIDELSKVKNPTVLNVLAVEGNPFALHPNLKPIVLKAFPKLVELDGERINDHIRQDISDAFKVSSKLMKHFYAVEQEVIFLDQKIKRIHIKHELLRKLQPRNGPYWEELNAISSRELMAAKKPIKIPRYDDTRLIRPFMLLNIIESTGDFQVPPLDDGELKRLYKWMFCETLLMLHSEGQHGLQRYLQVAVECEGEIDKLFQAQLYAFSLMAQVPKGDAHRADILPKQMPVKPAFKVAAKSFNEFSIEDLLWFPIFGCNQPYLKALSTIVTKQIELYSSLQEELLSLLKTDYSTFGLPSISEAERRLPRLLTPDKQDLQSSLRRKERKENKASNIDSRDTERAIMGRVAFSETDRPLHDYTKPEPVLVRPVLEFTVSPKKDIKRLQVAKTPSLSLQSPVRMSYEFSGQTSEYLHREVGPEGPQLPPPIKADASQTSDQEIDPEESKMLNFYRQYYAKNKTRNLMKVILKRWHTHSRRQQSLGKALYISLAYKARHCYMEWRKIYLEVFSAALTKAFEFRKHRMLNKPFKVLQLQSLRKRQEKLLARRKKSPRNPDKTKELRRKSPKDSEKLKECEVLMRRLMSPRHKLCKHNKENKSLKPKLKKTVKRACNK